MKTSTPNSSHLIGDEVPFAADGLAPIHGDSPPGVTSKRGVPDQHAQPMSDEEKIRCAAAVAVHQKYGTTISSEQREVVIEQVAQVLNSDAEMRERIIHSMDQILRRER